MCRRLAVMRICFRYYHHINKTVNDSGELLMLAVVLMVMTIVTALSVRLVCDRQMNLSIIRRQQ